MQCGTPCPSCGSRSSRTINSRPRSDRIYRRRECTGCGTRHSTEEVGPDYCVVPVAVLRALVGSAAQTSKLAAYLLPELPAGAKVGESHTPQEPEHDSLRPD